MLVVGSEVCKCAVLNQTIRSVDVGGNVTALCIRNFCTNDGVQDFLPDNVGCAWTSFKHISHGLGLFGSGGYALAYRALLLIKHTLARRNYSP